MILQENIKKKAEGFGKLAPMFLEAADYALSNQWISVKEDLPCNHEELIKLHRITKYVIVMYKDGSVALDRMVKINNGYWRFVGAVTHWFPIPKLPKE